MFAQVPIKKKEMCKIYMGYIRADHRKPYNAIRGHLLTEVVDIASLLFTVPVYQKSPTNDLADDFNKN